MICQLVGCHNIVILSILKETAGQNFHEFLHQCEIVVWTVWTSIIFKNNNSNRFKTLIWRLKLYFGIKMTRKRPMIKWVLTHFCDFLGELHFARSLSSKIKNCSSSVERLNSFFLETELIAFFCSISFCWNWDEKLILRCLFGVGTVRRFRNYQNKPIRPEGRIVFSNSIYSRFR